MVEYDFIAENLAKVTARMRTAAEIANRQPDEVKLVVVTKLQPVEAIRVAAAAGARCFGENYAEEAAEKIEALDGPAGIEWHMIGHVQSRKARLVSEHFDMVESLDSAKLGRKLSGCLLEAGRRMPALLEFNLGGEESKSGFEAADEAGWKGLINGVAEICAMGGLDVCGLMTMPPLYTDPEKTRPFFQKLRRLRDYLNYNIPQLNLRELSMGTSADFEVAIQEGATIVRVGQSIMGKRISKE